MRQPFKTILTATALAGTLDIVGAFIFSGIDGRTPAAVLQSVAAGPFPDLAQGTSEAAIGLAVHFAIMLAMAGAYVLAAARLRTLRERPVVMGALYGFGLYAFMYWIVLPLRWPSLFPQTGSWAIGTAIFLHVVAVGIPIALITARGLRGRR